MQVSRGVKESIEVGIEKMVVDSWGIEQVSSNKELDPRTEARSIHLVSRSYQGGKSILDQSTKCRGAIEEAEAFSIDPLGIEEVSRLR